MKLWRRQESPRGRTHPSRRGALLCIGLVGALACGSFAAIPASASSSSGATYIVSEPTAATSSIVEQIVDLVGGEVLQNLGVANAVSAVLSPLEVTLLRLDPGVVVTPDLAVSLQDADATSPSRAPAAVFPEQTGATQLWSNGDDGSGVNVAVLDTGIDAVPDLAGRLVGGVDLSGGGNPFDDEYGHGTFVAGLIAGDGNSSGGAYMGEAPGVGLVSVKVAGANGQTDLATVIEGVGWTIAHAAALHIRVLNMSLGVVPMESSEIDPLDQAVQAAWNAGIVVVASAGNDGPSNGTILSPGDDPMIITAGASNDLGQTNPANDEMASFSSVGPTDPDGWFKPDLVAPGVSVVSLAAPGSTVYDENPSARIGAGNFVGSGTSFSAAITSGAAALVIAAHPSDTPNDVKAALLSTTNPGPVGNPFVDGHGSLDAALAAASNGATLSNNGGPGWGIAALGRTVQLSSTWSMSSWDPANWVGLSPATSAGSSPENGGVWSGSEWNGVAWSGTAWSGSEWNGETWNGSEWNGVAWNGSEWNGSEWNGDSWS